MDDIERSRQRVKWNINNNPTEITIVRIKKIEVDGHLEAAEPEVNQYTVRIFRKKNSGDAKEVTGLGGTKQVDEAWGLLADYQADIQAGPDNCDKFHVKGLGDFRVTSVIPQMVRGQIIGLQADIQRVI